MLFISKSQYRDRRLLWLDGTPTSKRPGFCDDLLTAFKKKDNQLDPSDPSTSINEKESIVIGFVGALPVRGIREYLQEQSAAQISWKHTISIKFPEGKDTIELTPFIVFLYEQDRYMFLQVLLVEKSLSMKLHEGKKGIWFPARDDYAIFTFGGLLKELTTGPIPLLATDQMSLAEDYCYRVEKFSDKES